MSEKNRVKIKAGAKKVGDKINDKKITGLGKAWFEKVTDENACVYGMQPGLDHYPMLSFQYAYLEE
jgi:hypothetical protein